MLDQGGSPANPNPSTETKQDDIIAGLLAVETNQTDGSQKTQITDKDGNLTSVDGLGSLKTYEASQIVGESFEGDVLDTKFWSAIVANGGTVTQDGQIDLETNTTANGTAQADSVRKARKIPGTVGQFRSVGQFSTIGEADNVRTIGISNFGTRGVDESGAWFKLDGTTFKIVTSSGGTETEVSSGNFNGDVSEYTLDTNIHRFAIDYTSYVVKFWIDGVLIHKVLSTDAFWTDSLTLGIRATNVNSNDNTTNNKLHFQLLTILRLGQLRTAKAYNYENTTGTYILKYGAGAVQGLAISNVTNNSVITLYDNTAASGDILWNSGDLAANALPFNIPLYGIDFFTGLTLSITGADADVTVVYE